MERYRNKLLHHASSGICGNSLASAFQTQQFLELCAAAEHVFLLLTSLIPRYGFHKVNKTPRGYKIASENQVWEFSHTKFIRHRPDLLDEIKRRQGDVDFLREGDLSTHMSLMQVQQNDIMKQVTLPDSRLTCS